MNRKLPVDLAVELEDIEQQLMELQTTASSLLGRVAKAHRWLYQWLETPEPKPRARRR